MKRELEKLIKKYTEERNNYHSYLEASEKYLEEIKKTGDKKSIQYEEEYRYRLVVKCNDYYDFINDLEELLKEA